MANETIFDFKLRQNNDDDETREEVLAYEKGYLNRPTSYTANSEEADRRALEAGEGIRNGDRTKENLKVIYHWKNGESLYYESRLEPAFDANSDDAIANALNTAVNANTEWEAIEALTVLSGVKVPTASAILTNIYPEKYTVIDVQALRALGINNPEITFYLLYNAHCRGLAEKYNVPLRTLDRALWEWGKTHPPKRKRRKKTVPSTA